MTSTNKDIYTYTRTIETNRKGFFSSGTIYRLQGDVLIICWTKEILLGNILIRTLNFNLIKYYLE